MSGLIICYPDNLLSGLIICYPVVPLTSSPGSDQSRSGIAEIAKKTQAGKYCFLIFEVKTADILNI